ncbi:hypothetical protein ACJZ2D_008240 [Fusarium nematophilum]
MARRLRSTVLWAGLLVLLHLTTFVRGLASSPYTDTPPRAALVTLTHEDDLGAMLFTMKQLEDKFNSRYHYHWVFFSTQELGDDFKELTSNATNATCIYEVIPDENWSIPGWTDQHNTPMSQEAHMDHDSETLRPTTNIRQMNRWNSAPFAKERRLRDYDWFWRVEPGAQLTQDVPFDVFRFMRDNGIAYGFNRVILGQTSLRALSPRIKSFVDMHPDLLHEEADISWLLDHASDSVTSSSALGDDSEDSLMEEGKGVLSSVYPTFEIGSLAFFRSPNHVAFFDHLDSAGDFKYRRVDDVPVHTLSASMFLPRQSVWNFRKKDMRHRARHAHRPSQPQATPGFDHESTGEANMGWTRSVEWIGDSKEAMSALLAAWDAMARDLGRQEAIPGLMSGNTVIDERNFALA